MKTQFLAAAVIALISMNAMGETWKGSGAVFTPDGRQLESYDLEVVNQQLSADVIQSDATETAKDGSKTTISQKLTMKGSSWQDDSSLGKGGGACYGGDLCENYIQGANGMAYATSIVSDGPSVRRQVTFVLQNGKAIKVLRDNLTRVP